MSDSSEPQFDGVIALAAAGDGRAWQQLVEVYAKRVFALIRSQGIDADLAEEITQSTFATLAGKLADYQNIGRFESWLFRIAMNRLRDEMRRRKRHARPMEHQSLTARADATNDTAETEDLSPELIRLRAAMSQLNDADREIVQLRHYAELGFKEIAAMLGQPLGTVLARQHRALQKLADLMTADDDRDSGLPGEGIDST